MDKVIALLKPTPFKVGCLVVLASCVLFYSFGQGKPELLSSLDNQITNTMFRWRGPQETTGQVVIVDIDEKSLRKIGQWPWPRDIVARLVRSLHAGGAKVIGFDIVFPERDRTSITGYIDSLSQLIGEERVSSALQGVKDRKDLDHDLILGKAVAEARVVLGYVFYMQNDGLRRDDERPFPSGAITISPKGFSCRDLSLIPGYRAILNIPDISQAQSEGFLNVFPDSSGMVRKVPLFMDLDGIPYPSIALEMVRTAANEQGATIDVSRQKAAGKNAILGVTSGNIFIPTDDRGQVTVNFRGPVKTFTYLSASDVLNGLNPDQIKGKYVLIGTSASGLLDFHATPFSGIFPGVEIQATVIDNILTDSLFTYDIFTEIGLTYTLIIAGGIVLSALLAYTGALTGGLTGLLLIGCIITGNYFLFFLNGKILGMTYPLATIILIFLVVTLSNYFFEYRKKKFISTAFSRYVSPLIVSEIVKQPEKLTLSGEEKALTIMFSDIRNFTSISESMDAKRLGRFMNKYLSVMSDVIMEHHGMVDKYIGDAIMAIWGAPLDDSLHAGNAVRAALSMKATLDELRNDPDLRDLPLLEIGIGINTGIVSVGNFGSEKRFEYTVLGDNVNLASRLEGLNKFYGTSMIISEHTRDALNGEIFCRKIGKALVKGKSMPIDIYEPLMVGSPDAVLRDEVMRFEEAQRCYCLQDFESARKIIKDLNDAKQSKIYELYLEQIARYIETPPPSGWQGITIFESK